MSGTGGLSFVVLSAAAISADPMLIKRCDANGPRSFVRPSSRAFVKKPDVINYRSPNRTGGGALGQYWIIFWTPQMASSALMRPSEGSKIWAKSVQKFGSECPPCPVLEPGLNNMGILSNHFCGKRMSALPTV